MVLRRIHPNRARRLALAAQGFNDPRPTGRVDIRHFRRVMQRMGVLQLDSVNVIARAHYLPFLSRLGPYDRGALDSWLWRSGELFESWIHEASLTWMERRPALVHRMDRRHPWRSVQEVLDQHPDFVDRVLHHVRNEGPLTVGDLPEGSSRTGPWWGWGPGKLALEWLFASGALSILDRPNFTRLYDVTERVIPPHVLAQPGLDPTAARRVLLRDAVRHHGIGTVADLADYHRMRMTDAKPILADLAAAGEIEEVVVDGWKGPVYLDPELPIPRSIDGTALLAPFDPVVWFRDRAERLFGFHYRIEIYVPKPKRVHGYYVLPVLVDGDLAARVDLKADRAGGRLLVQGAFVEAGRDPVAVGRRLSAALVEMAEWQGLSEIELRPNGDLVDQLSV